jgi:hypothetical protein
MSYSVTLLSASTTVPDTSSYVALQPGRYKIAVSFASSETAARIAINEKEGSGDARVVSKSGAAVALSQADPAVEYACGGESVSVTRTLGSIAATVTATRIEQGSGS